jgi:hypothetical protein
MEHIDETQPKAYEAPEVTDYASLTDLTAASSGGAFTDKDFPAHTPFGDITAS